MLTMAEDTKPVEAVEVDAEPFDVVADHDAQVEVEKAKTLATAAASRQLPDQCAAIAAYTSERCLSFPVFGGTLCRQHGGAQPYSQRLAKAHLASLVPAAIARFEYIINDPHEDRQIVLRAVFGLLDRTGHGPGSKVEFAGVIGTLNPRVLEKFSDDELGIVIQATRLLAAAGGGAEEAPGEPDQQAVP